jgi:hypothetical protein
MYQIDNSSAVAAIPASTAAGTPGYFTDGNPATGIAPTILPAEFMNMVMMEILGVLSAGGVTPSKSNFTQLTTAIRAVNKQSTILTDTGAANIYAAANTPALTALPATGYSQRLNIAHANTGASTYAPDGLTAKPIYGLGLQPLQGGELPVGIAVLMYLVQSGVNGGNGAWIIIESLGGASQIANATQSQHAVNMGQLFGGLKGIVKFTSSGSFTVPVGVTTIYHSGSAAGGGGGSSLTVLAGTVTGGAGGGGAGQWEIRKAYTVTPGQVITVTVGLGGSGGAAGGANGSPGGNTILSGVVTLTGGSGGVLSASAVTPAVTANSAGGAGFPGGEFSSTTNQYGGGKGGNGASTPFGSGGFGSPGTNGGATGGGVAALANTGGGGGGAGGSFGSASSTGAAGGAGGSGSSTIEW